VKIIVAGLQRSGTNFFKELLIQNCSSTLEEHNDEIKSWKHDFPENIYIPSNTKLFYIRKNPYNWMYSIDKQPEDIHKRFNIGSEEGLALHYRDHCLAWAQFIEKRKVFYTQYETLLKNPRFVVNRALRFYNLRMKETFVRPEKVNLSPDYNPEIYDKMYIDSEFKVSKVYSKMIEKYLRWFLWDN